MLVFAFFIWLGNGLMIAHLKSGAVLINDRQLPLLDKTFQDVCQKLDIREAPELYVLESAGALNAFAMRHCGRNFVVVNSDIVSGVSRLPVCSRESCPVFSIVKYRMGDGAGFNARLTAKRETPVYMHTVKTAMKSVLFWAMNWATLSPGIWPNEC